ncbi:MULTISPECIES: Druantia anti-phage system protein DruA [Enterobacter cloacae complex]|uniref:Druantia anti-phage system protein DruA n=1 Tax=Enterobacter cloacae complex TaxID=354276 RepID=UPI001238E586|nr:MULTISPECIES: Druantia anti-phage system protein DruA [Enterobacter cloacae complex]MDN5009014.1 Druantia anti-phage system protein DruA [Enterobacter hormaechei]MDO1526091.1 Druantia anti-phage system protein DruA [Enterobacter hormaechei]
MHKDPSIIVNVNLREARLKKKVREHLQSLGFTKSDAGALQAPGNTKEVIRTLHSAQRAERLAANQNFITLKSSKLLKFFASGKDVIPDKISPVLERVSSGTWQGDLFRLAALTWSVPVSNGFGRRLRYLVWDESNGKLIGLIAIGDPVFNLAVRDRLIGWSTEDRSSRLVNVMDAYVLGALPPYNFLLGGKLVACLLRSRELYDDFARVYGNSVGVISQKKKRARLLAITTTSSMGRSSVYNRLKLDGIQYMEPIGYTGGWGHFHIPDSLFIELRDYLRDMDHRYADHHMFGNGPNWRLRTMKAALNALGFRDDMMKHGIQREVFISQLADNATNILQTGRGKPDLTSLLSAKDIAERAMDRWMIPRSIRKTEYRSWNSDYLFDFIDNDRLSLEVETDKKKTIS